MNGLVGVRRSRRTPTQNLLLRWTLGRRQQAKLTLGKTAHGPGPDLPHPTTRPRRCCHGRRTQGDEDEGSPSRDGANRTTRQVASLETGKIDRSAEALRVRHHPSPFPSKQINPAYNANRATGRTKLRGMALAVGAQHARSLVWSQAVSPPGLPQGVIFVDWRVLTCVESWVISARRMRLPSS